MTEKGFNCAQRKRDMIERFKKDGRLTPEAEARLNACPYLDQELETNNVTFGKGACLCICKNPSFQTYLLLYDQVDKGTMPELGGVLDQSAQIAEVLQHIKQLQMQYEQEERKKAEKSSKAQNRVHRRR